MTGAVSNARLVADLQAFTLAVHMVEPGSGARSIHVVETCTENRRKRTYRPISRTKQRQSQQ